MRIMLDAAQTQVLCHLLTPMSTAVRKMRISLQRHCTQEERVENAAVANCVGMPPASKLDRGR